MFSQGSTAGFASGSGGLEVVIIPISSISLTSKFATEKYESSGPLWAYMNY